MGTYGQDAKHYVHGHHPLTFEGGSAATTPATGEPASAVPQHLQQVGAAATAAATTTTTASGGGGGGGGSNMSSAAVATATATESHPWTDTTTTTSRPPPPPLMTIHDDYTRMEDGQRTTQPPSSSDPTLIRTPPSVSFGTEFVDEDHGGEDDDDNNTHGGASSMISADEIADPAGFGVIALLSFLTDMSRGVFFPVMWSLVQSLGGTEVNLGYTISSFAFGKIMVTPLFGSWSATYGYRPTLLFSASVLLFGTVLFVLVPAVNSPTFLIVANTTLGIGSGSNGVTRAFVADVTPQRNRTTYMGWLKGASYAGFATTPFLGAFLSWWFTQDGRGIEKGAFILNQFTAPAYFMMPMIIFEIYLLATALHEPNRPDHDDVFTSAGGKKKRQSNKRRAHRDRIGKQSSFFSALTMNQACLLGIMCLNIAVTAAVGCFETVGMQFAEHFGLDGAQAGAIVATCGTVGLLFLLSMGWITDRFTDVQIICGSLAAMLVGMLLNATMDDDGVYAKERYLFSIFSMYSVGFPIGHTAVIGLCSKVIGKQPQGKLLGYFSSSGALARLIFPIVAEYIVVGLGMQALFIFLSVFLFIVLCVAIAFRKTLADLSV